MVASICSMAETPVELLPPEPEGPGAPPLAAHSPSLRLRALADVREKIRAHCGELAVGAGAALFVAAAGWLCAAALTLAVWATAAPANSAIAMPLHVAGQLWLAAHHVILQTPGGPFGL